MKIKVGDKVKFRSDLKANQHYGGCIWSTDNNRWLGKEVTVSRCCINTFKIEGYKGIDNCFTEEMLTPLKKPEIHITTDGTTTYAVMKQNGKVVKRSKNYLFAG